MTENALPDSVSNEMHAGYARTMLAVRTTGTTTAMVAQAMFFVEQRAIPEMLDILENMVKGGVDALPPLTKLIFGHHTWLYPAISCLSLALVGLMWVRARRLDTAIWLSFTATILPLLAAVIFRFSVQHPLLRVITDFGSP